jgi:hypothetical protein
MDVPPARLGNLDRGPSIGDGLAHSVREQIAAAHLLIVLGVELPPAPLGKKRGLDQNAGGRRDGLFRSHCIAEGNH